MIRMILALLVFSNFAQGGTREEISAAIKNEMACGYVKVRDVDDRISDASTVAFALYSVCAEQYGIVTSAMLKTFDNENQRFLYSKGRQEKDKKVEEFLPIVMDFRRYERDKIQAK